MQPQEQVRRLIDQLNRLPPERVAEVADFVDFLKVREQDHAFSRELAHVSEPLLTRLWENPEDAAYDEL
jgi:hypothetical protein